MIAGANSRSKSNQNANIPLAVPRAPLPMNPFYQSKNKSVKSNDPLALEEVKKNPLKMSVEKKVEPSQKEPAGTQLIYLDTEQAEILNTQQNEQEEGDKLPEEKAPTLIDVIGEEGSGSGSFEDGLKTKAFYARYILIDQAVSAFSFLSIVIALIEYDLEFEEREDFVAQSMLWMTFILTLGMILLTVVRFQAKLDWLKTRKIISEKSNLITSGYFKSMIVEIVISAVHPMPWTWKQRIEFFNEPQQAYVYYHLNEILLLIMLLRVLLIVRTLLMMSVWYNNRTQRVCSMYACEANYLFVVKCIMNKQPYMLVTTAMVISIFYFGFAVRICEAPLMRNDTANKLLFFSFWNCIWNIIVTMTTVGYGDYYAQTHLGRFVIFFVCLWGVGIVSLMVITLNSTLQIQPLESKAIAVLERLDLKGQMKNHAAMVLTLLGRIGIANRKGTFEGEFKRKTQMKLRAALTSFKIAQRQYRSISDENVSEEMGRQFDFLRDDLKEIFQKQNSILESNIFLMQHLKMDQQQIEYYAKNLARSSFQLLVTNKEEKNPVESSHFKQSQNPQVGGTSAPVKKTTVQEEIMEKVSENEDQPNNNLE